MRRWEFDGGPWGCVGWTWMDWVQYEEVPEVRRGRISDTWREEVVTPSSSIDQSLQGQDSLD